eukprot:4876541-Prymnesium_polylepis.1
MREPRLLEQPEEVILPVPAIVDGRVEPLVHAPPPHLRPQQPRQLQFELGRRVAARRCRLRPPLHGRVR